jgi:hypothetical protein
MLWRADILEVAGWLREFLSYGWGVGWLLRSCICASHLLSLTPSSGGQMDPVGVAIKR